MDEINEIQDDRQKRIDSIVEDFEKAYETDNRKVREELIKDKDNFEFYKHYMEDWKSIENNITEGCSAISSTQQKKV